VSPRQGRRDGSLDDRGRKGVRSDPFSSTIRAFRQNVMQV
jgi:hypothetical protein